MHVLRYAVVLLTFGLVMLSYNSGFTPTEIMQLSTTQVWTITLWSIGVLLIVSFLYGCYTNFNNHTNSFEWPTIVYGMICTALLLVGVGGAATQILTALYTVEMQTVLWTGGQLILCVLVLGFTFNMLSYGTLLKS